MTAPPDYAPSSSGLEHGSRPAGAGGWWTLVPVAWRRAVIATAALWFVVLVVTAVAGTVPAGPVVVDAGAPGFPLWPPPPTDATGGSLLAGALVRFDALYHLSIASVGYPPASATPGGVADAYAFLPGYAGSVAAVAAVLGGRIVLAATLVSSVSTVAALAGVHRLVELVAPGPDRAATMRTAGRAVAFTALYPTSFFLLAPYAESLHLAAVVWALVLGARGTTAAPVALGVLAGVTRPVGVLLAPALWLVGRDTARDGSRGRWRAALLGLSPALGLGIAMGVGAVRAGEPLAFVLAQARWQREWVWPWRTIRDAVRFAANGLGGPTSGYYVLDLVALVVVAIAAGALLRSLATGRLPSSRLVAALLLHAAASVGLWLVNVFPGRPLMSVPRFSLVVPAVVVGLVVVGERRWAERSWTLVSGALLGVHLLLFSRWYLVF